MKSNLLTELVAVLFGRAYYANIIGTRGVDRMELCSYIFATREAAERHRAELSSTMSFVHVETVRFRSRRVPLRLTVKS